MYNYALLVEGGWKLCHCEGWRFLRDCFSFLCKDSRDFLEAGDGEERWDDEMNINNGEKVPGDEEEVLR